ncbi:TetR/AcrR family transcriptional regulator [Agreia sp.]|uniref:TetR/AcrR family transcriptional regulator n=1 Tax=Agreia sp. TaxID=1872416 RepID=UPI0035BC6BC6
MDLPSATPGTNERARTDPRILRSRDLILDAALGCFLARGYLAATVDGIAVEAGVAKRTVFNLYGTKDELFRAVIARATEISEKFVVDRVESPIGVLPIDQEVAEFALAHARAVITPQVISTRRLLIGEALRFPELASDYFDRVPGRIMGAIADRLLRYAVLGTLHVPEPRRAAEHFAYLVLGEALDRSLFQPGSITDAQVEAAALRGADAFVRAYRTR